MSLPLFGLSLIFSIALCIHAVRTGQQTFWLWVILMLQPLGGLVYLIAILGPELTGGRTARRLTVAARDTLDPHREYRDAKHACDEAPTVRNLSRLASAAANMNRPDEAERLYAEAAQGVYADDGVLLLGRAKALLDLDRATEALSLLDRLVAAGDTAPGISLALARAYEATGRMSDAERAFQTAIERLTGFEALGRHAAFLAHTGRRAEATAALADIDRRLEKTNAQFRKEGRLWRDLAAQALMRG